MKNWRFAVQGTGRAFWTAVFLSNGANGSSWLPIYLESPTMSLISRICVYASYCLALSLVATRFSKQLAPLFRRKDLLWASSFVAVLGIALTCFGGIGILPQVSLFIGMLLIGLGGAFPLMAWSEFYAYLGVKNACVYYCASALFGAILYLLFVLFGAAEPIVASLVLMCFPPISVMLLFAAVKSDKMSELKVREVLGQRFRVPFMLLLAMVVYGFVFGVFLGLDGAQVGVSRDIYNSGNALGMGVFSGLFLILFFFRKTIFSLKQGFRPLMLSFVVPLLLIPVLFDSIPFIVNFSAYAGYTYMTILATATYTEIVHKTGISPLRVAPLVIAAYSVGMPLGSVACTLLLYWIDLATLGLYLIVIVATIILIFATILLLSETSISSLWGLTSTAAVQLYDEIIARQAETFSKDLNLTQREYELLPFLLARKSTQDVAEALGISVYTVRAHTANIYAKADVHSQKELINLAGHSVDKIF